MTNICTPDSHQTRHDKNLRPWWWGWRSVLVEVSRYIPAPGCSTHWSSVGDRAAATHRLYLRSRHDVDDPRSVCILARVIRTDQCGDSNRALTIPSPALDTSRVRPSRSWSGVKVGGRRDRVGIPLTVPPAFPYAPTGAVCM
jgi:hypothetical protein